MHKRFLPLLLSFLLLLSLSAPVLAEAQEEPVPAKTLQITSLEDFLSFAENCRLDSYSQNLIVELTGDISLASSDFQGIPTFSGTFRGNDHTISGLDITASGSVQGLFRYLTDTAVVEDLHVEGSVHPQGSQATVGSIAGSNAGSIRNCSFSGTLSGSDSVGGIVGSNAVTGMIENCQTEGNLHGQHFVGGIAGSSTGVIRGCTNAMQVNTTPQQNTVELSQITLETITEAESIRAVTDIGGIAGHSGGVIRSCTNYGDVGYPHMGYNIGGIAGSQMGYITDCENHGAVSGRKEVGGIVGQMEPSTNIQFTTDTLQILKGQLDALGGLANRASAHVQGSASSVNSQISSIRDHAEAAKDAVDQLLPDRENPQLPNLDSIQAAQNALNSSFRGMQSSLNSISSTMKSTVGTLQKDMQAISNQVNAMGQTINGASENLGGSITDISDDDTPEDVTGKVEKCHNYAAVLADLNAGGITGAIALENDLDPEEDMDITGEFSLNFDSQLRAVVLSCYNQGTVTASKQNAGGIVGWMSMGLAKDCHNTGDLSAEAASYVGGIAGQSSGALRSCSAKSTIAGKLYVGGIAGTGKTVSDCRSMNTLSATEKLGGILGYGENREEIIGNYYLAADSDPGAIDGISYQDCAQALDSEAFLALEGLQPFFNTITVRFCFEDGSEKTHTLKYGQSLTSSDLPEIPVKEGCLSYWEGWEEGPLFFDTVLTAGYTTLTTVIQTPADETGLPLLLAEGSFGENVIITCSPAASTPALQQNQTLLQALSFKVSESSTPITLRCRLPEKINTNAITVLVQQPDGSWEAVSCRIADSYAVFSTASGENHIAIVETAQFPWLLNGSIAAGVLLLCIVVIVAVQRTRKKSTPPENTAK